ncbi:hypothetical protein B1A99_28260 [Cohnella sp. CIP 111063]|jgi:hypothetical protein|uniref:hypothetical protein n=1 Tax=unclassified Cohnella TaxID=2636738 RepID=UPI000B8C5741|nr:MULTISPECIES: hypothetical protein [unclassified Cohnella]OXS53799.1 hypothetical protein B1A99_28260 [Cohnella sp. CIP 111063]PRX62375.1 hypothetical protein B0G52_12310 [Cohnella sp. SGD-V74]
MSRKMTLWILIVTQALFVLFIPVWLFLAGMSVMLFDDPDAAGHATVWLIFIAILLYPVGLLLGIVFGWVKFSRRRYRAAIVWNAVPWLWIAPLGGFLLFANFS